MDSYETANVNWRTSPNLFQKAPTIEQDFLRYAGYLVNRGLIANTFGNIAIRVREAHTRTDGVIYTKCRGVSLEEMTLDHIVVTDVRDNELLFGTVPPSNGHQMNRAILLCRPDTMAIIHTHPDYVIAYFSQYPNDSFSFISIDTALVLGAPPRILPPNVNLEADATCARDLVANTQCLVMPNHGLITLGRTLSEAYHRHTAFIAEVRRVALARLLRIPASDIEYVTDSETERLYRLGDRVIYGKAL